jgi:hypothetical protein
VTTTTTNKRRAGVTTVEAPGASPEAVLRLNRLGRELRLTDQILSVDMDTVSIVPSGPAPAWTTLDGDAVSFALDKMPAPTSRDAVAVWLGTNAHELGHVLFTPRRNSPLMRLVLESESLDRRGIAQLHNIVEDQREERLLLGRFAPWRTYLTAALGHHLVANSETAWLLMAGRTWLPDAVRAEARARFVEAWNEATADEVTSIVGEYQYLTDPGDTEADEAWRLLCQLHGIFDGAMPKLPRSCTVMTGGEPDTSEPATSCPPTASEASEPGTEPGDEGEGEGDEGDDAEGEGEGKAAKPGEPTSEPGKGAGSEPSKPGTVQRELRDALSKAASDQLRSDEEVRAELDSVLDALRHGRAGDDASGEEPIGRYEPATDAARRLHHEVGDALLDLKDASEPGWVRRTDSGRLNVRRLLNPSVDVDELFDRYEPGQMDASQLELCLLLDVSGSMAGQRHALAETAWAIRQAVDDIEGAATVIAWDSGPHRIMSRAGDRPDDRMFVPAATGGTLPTSALAETHRLLADSSARHRLCVILTDGDWYSTGEPHKLIGAMRDAGVVTVLAQLGAGALDPHGCEHAATIGELSDLARLFGRIARDRIGSWL